MIRRILTIPEPENRLYTFMNLVNDIAFSGENKLTSKELNILYKLYEYDHSEITTQTKNKLMDDFNFSSKNQIGAYISILFKKGAIFKSPTKTWVYTYNPIFFYPLDTYVSEIIIRFDGKKEGS